MKITTLSLLSLSALSLVSCQYFGKNSNPYGAPAAGQADSYADPYAVPLSNGNANYAAQDAPYQQIPGVIAPTQAQAPAYNQSYTPEVPATQPAAGSTLPYVVKSGDSLWKISRENNTTVQAIQEANGLTNTNIRAGQTLQIPNN